jgi:hypothetical protein
MMHVKFSPLFVAFALTTASCASLPAGDKQGADDVARAIEVGVNKAAWDATGAVKFGFRKQRVHVWDKARGFFHTTSGDEEVWLDVWDQGGVAKKGGVEVTDEAQRTKMLAQAWTLFCNDTFWLNPLAKLFDDGVTRELVTIDDKRGLKVSYASGGTTPGDSYVWILSDDPAKEPRPVAVRMWVSVLPVKGIEFSWTSWTTLATGALITTTHSAGPVDVTIDDPVGATSLSALEPGAPDRFAVLVARRAAASSASAASSGAHTSAR